MTRQQNNARGGFTLIEILLAAVAAALVLTAVYGIFRQAVRIRDSATQHTRDSRVRLRAEKIIRADLNNALVTGGLFANVCEGDSSNADHGLSNANSGAVHSPPSNLPGFFRFTTTTGRNDAATGLYGDVQQVEYYIAQDPKAADQSASGILVRSVNRDLLDTGGTGGSSSSSSSSSSNTNTGANTNANGNTTPGTSAETAVLAGVQSFQVSFYDGANWQTSWQFSDLAERIVPAASASSTSTSTTTQTVTGQTSLPDAVRIDIQQAPATPGGPLPPPLEILVPWTTQPYVAATPANAGSASQ